MYLLLLFLGWPEKSLNCQRACIYIICGKQHNNVGGFINDLAFCLRDEEEYLQFKGASACESGTVINLLAQSQCVVMVMIAMICICRLWTLESWHDPFFSCSRALQLMIVENSQIIVPVFHVALKMHSHVTLFLFF